MKYFLIVLVLGVSLESFAGVGKSVAIGAATGATTGVLGGLYVGGKPYGKSFAKKGLLWGSLSGALSGYFIHKYLEKRDKRVRRETLLNLKKFDVVDFAKNPEEDSGCDSTQGLTTLKDLRGESRCHSNHKEDY